MGRRNRGTTPGGHKDQTDWESERTLATAEEDAPAADVTALRPESDTRCVCGSSELLLEAFLQVSDGVVQPGLVEAGQLTCPECGREFEAIEGEGGKILRGDFLGHAAVDDEE